MDPWVDGGDDLWEGEMDEVHKAAVGDLPRELVVLPYSRVLDDRDV